jgi:hypothetical protein
VISLVILGGVMTLMRMRNIVRRAKNLNDRFCYKGAAVGKN